MQAQTKGECLTTWCSGKAGHAGAHNTNECTHLSMTGNEGPIIELGRWPRLWICDTCGTEVVREASDA